MPRTKLVVAFRGLSITPERYRQLERAQDGWPDVLSRRLRKNRFGSKIAVVNAGIAGNRILKPDIYGCAKKPDASGPAALQRFETRVLILSGLEADQLAPKAATISGRMAGASLKELEQAITCGVRAMRSPTAAVRVIGATLTSARGSPDYGGREEDRQSAERLA